MISMIEDNYCTSRPAAPRTEQREALSNIT
jgi:hypothetical protein